MQEAIVKLKDIAWRTDDDVTFRAINAVIDKLQVKPEPTGIGNTLRDIAEESCLNKAESVALIRIAREVDQLQAQIDKLVEGQQAKTKAGS